MFPGLDKSNFSDVRLRNRVMRLFVFSMYLFVNVLPY